MEQGNCNSTTCDGGAYQGDSAEGGLISTAAFETFKLIICGVVWIILSIVGIVTNTINMVVFRRMGFSETVNITLFALALSDLLSLITTGWDGIWLNPFWRNIDLPFDPTLLGHLTGGWPHVICIRVTGWLTALVSFERFMCIARPLEVKMIFTPLRVKIAIAAIYILNLLPPLAIVTYTHRLVWNTIGNETASFLTLAYSQDREDVEGISNIFVQNISPLLTFAMVVAPTIGLVVKLNEKKKWRDAAALSANSAKTSASSKDSRAAKMVTIVSVIYIICFTPTIAVFVVYVMLPGEFHWTGRLHYIFVISFSITFIFEGVNSNVNFFIYYKMSSRFKQAFKEICGKKNEP